MKSVIWLSNDNLAWNQLVLVLTYWLYQKNTKNTILTSSGSFGPPSIAMDVVRRPQSTVGNLQELYGTGGPASYTAMFRREVQTFVATPQLGG